MRSRSPWQTIHRSPGSPAPPARKKPPPAMLPPSPEPRARKRKQTRMRPPNRASLVRKTATLTNGITKLGRRCTKNGENPHQSAKFYASTKAIPFSLATGKQLQGKEMSYNNIQDANA
ncbi:MAG: hypothetical protein II295_02780, partial [Akkermansia sp.]|nr:hypothetical protein [Akkermansia sp.]